MIDAFVIGAKLNLDDKIFEQMDALVESFTRTQQMVDRINRTLREMGHGARTAADGVKALARAWQEVATATARAAGAADRMTAARPGAPGWSSDRAIDRAAPLMIGSGGRRTGGPDEPFYPPVPIDGRRGVYDRSRSNFGFGGGGGDEPPGIPLGGGFGGGRSRRGRAEHDYASDIFFGGMVAGGAGAVARAAWNAASAPAHQRALLLENGVAPRDVSRMQAAALKIQQTIPGMGYNQALTIVRDAFSVTRNVNDAIAVAPTLARDAVILHQNPAHGGKDIDAMFRALQSAEIHGELNRKNPNGSLNLDPFKRYMALATQLAIATGFRFTPDDLKQLSRNAGPEFKTMSDHAIIEAGVMSLDLGAGRVGTGLNAISQEFVGGRMSKASLQILRQMGIASKNPALIHHTAMGRVQIAPGGIVDQRLLATDPTEWAYKYLLPAIERKYGSSPVEIQAGIQQVMARIPGARVVANMFNNRTLIERYLMGMAKVPGTGDLLKIIEKNDPNNALDQLTSAFTAALAKSFGPDLKLLSEAERALAHVLNDYTNWVQKHHWASYAEGLGVVGAGLGGGALTLRGIYGLGKKVLGRGEKAPKTADDLVDDAIRDLKRTARNARTGAAEGGETGGIEGAAIGAVVAAIMGPVFDKLGHYVHDLGGDVGDAIAHALGAQPLPVHVTNGHDLAAGVTRQQAKTAARMPASSAAPNVHLNPPMPGWAAAGIVNP